MSSSDDSDEVENQDFPATACEGDDDSSSSGSQGDDQGNYASADNKLDLNIFGIKIQELDGSVKFLIGISLIILVFGVVLYGLKRIRDETRKEKKIKKNKKTKQISFHIIF